MSVNGPHADDTETTPPSRNVLWRTDDSERDKRMKFRLLSYLYFQSVIFGAKHGTSASPAKPNTNSFVKVNRCPAVLISLSLSVKGYDFLSPFCTMK